jgi:hypothetical protein
LEFRRAENVLPEVWAEILCCSHVHFPSGEQLGQSQFHTCYAYQSGDTILFELDKNVDIALCAEILTQR